MNKQLIEAYKEYIKILTDELDSLVGSAYVHGWRSSNVQAGIDARQKIAELSTPPAPDTTAEEIAMKHAIDFTDGEYIFNQEGIAAAMTDYANQKQREVAVAFAQWAYDKSATDADFDNWLENIYKK